MKAFFVNPPLPGRGSLVRDLLYGCWCGGRRVANVSFPPVPLALMAAVLGRDGIPAAVLDAPASRLTEEDVAARLAPGDLLFCVSSPLSAALDVPFLGRMKERRAVLTVLLGAYPTFQPQEALGRPEVDFIVRGEPECAVSELARILAGGGRPSPGGVPGLGCRDGGGPIRAPGMAREPDLDALPFPDRTLIPSGRRYFNPVVRHARFTTAFTSRGCAGRCVFCSSPAFHGGRVRYRSVGSVLGELGEIRRQGFREVFFRDENFTGDRDRLFAICDGMRRAGHGLAWTCSTRVDLVDPEVAHAMRGAGCRLVRMGLESGSQRVLDRIGKGISVAGTLAAFAACRAAGLDTHAHAMIGLPGETREDFAGTVRLVREADPTYLTISVCTPFPGTALHDRLGRRGDSRDTPYFDPLRPEGLHAAPVGGGLSEIPDGEIPGLLRDAYRGFYFRGSYLARHLARPGGPASLIRKARAGMAIALFARGRGA